MTDKDSMSIITPGDAQKAGYCLAGTKRWFALHPELDYRDFIRSGQIEVSRLPAEDASIQDILRKKKDRIGG